ncbi:MAG: DUF1697 domain-containing protein [Actinomycetota bacterium]
MPRYFAFLRGINVGGHRVKMERLRELFEEVGGENVSTFIASGNVIFDAESTDETALERRVEQHLHAALGYEAATFLRSLDELKTILAFEAFPAAELEKEGHTLFVLFLRGSLPQAAAEAVEALRTERDEFRVQGREIYWLCRGRTVDSLVSGAELGRAAGKAECTSRNITTLRKLVAKYSAG